MKNKAITNASWIIVCKLFQAGLSFIIGILAARYLGPSNYGLINYASSIVSFFIPIMNLGFSSILVYELINEPDKEGEILGTAIGTSFISAVFCIIGVNAFVAIVNASEYDTRAVCFLYSFILLFQAIEMIVYWFQAKLLSKYTSVVSLAAYTLVSFYKIICLIKQKSVYWFALTNSIEAFLIALALFALFKIKSKTKFSYSFSRAQSMVKRSRYFILSNMMINIFAHTDRIMLKLMLDENATGYYSAAISLCSASSFVFLAIIDSARPVILESKLRKNECDENLLYTYSIVFFISLLQSVIFTLFAKPIVGITFGRQYKNSIQALRIAVWYTTFSYIGGVRSIWVLANNYQRYLWKINLSGAFVNVMLNAVFIPVWGVSGAALASVITQFFINVVMGFIIPALRENNRILVKSMNPAVILHLTRKALKAFKDAH